LLKSTSVSSDTETTVTVDRHVVVYCPIHNAHRPRILSS